MTTELSDKIKKNLLDLQYSRYLQYYNTSIIILSTYIIGVIIGFVTKQIDYKNEGQLVLVGLISVGVVTFILLLMLRFKDHQEKIISEVKKLNLK